MNRSNRGDWQRVSKRQPCPICGKPDWCLFAGDPDRPVAAICARTESDQRAGEAGWLHRLGDDRLARFPRRRLVALVGHDRPRDRDDLGRLAARWRLPEDSPRLAELADSLGLTPGSLSRLSVGWSPDRRCWSFPMVNVHGNVVGIRLRWSDGRKRSVRGGREGLFIPIDPEVAGGRLLIGEGPTDAAALLDLGYCAIGRPSCTAGLKLVVELVQRQRPAEVIIVADNDVPGQRGARNLESVLAVYAPSVRIITPPSGAKDARAWLKRGATAADVERTIDAAPVRRLSIKVRRRGFHHG